MCAKELTPLALHANVSPCRLEDVHFVVDLLAKCFDEGHFFHGFKAVDKSGLARTINRLCKQGELLRQTYRGVEIVSAEIWLGELNGQLVGCLISAGIDNKGGNEREAYLIAVDPAARGKGIGSDLTDFFCSHYSGHPLYAQCYPTQKQMLDMFIRRGFVQYGKTHGGNHLLRFLSTALPE